MAMIKFEREVNIYELTEALHFMETQETTDRYYDKKMLIDGDYAKLDIEVDEYGDVTVL